jgi:serine phosphatase RsbU (regulator of sigma subunit)
MFVTVWLGVLEISTGKLTAANAGHEYPAVKPAGASFELFKDRHGLVIGAMEMTRYREYELQLEPGAKLFVYTDGVAEAANPRDELFGTERMIRALQGAEDGSPEEILDAVNAAVAEFAGSAPQFDDLTMLCLSYK